LGSCFGGEDEFKLLKSHPTLGELLLQPLPMELQDHMDDRRIVGGQDPTDLVLRHPAASEYLRGIGAHICPDHRRSFGVVSSPTPTGSITIPSGVPMIVSSNIPPVANRIVPSAIRPKLGNSGPTQSRSSVAVSMTSFRAIS
jgi:hypothetical protein